VDQRSPNYRDNAPMATAAPGEMIRLRFQGNGHSRGNNIDEEGRNPGNVTVYWKGKPDTEIVDISEFVTQNILQSSGFSDNSFSYYRDPNNRDKDLGLLDKGNWMELNLPKSMAPGRHMMVWVWSFKGAPQFSTCFDVMIKSDSAACTCSTPVAPTTMAPITTPMPRFM
jgi:hypothetical protein